MSDPKEDVVRSLRGDLSDACFICGETVWWNMKIDPPEPAHMVIDLNDDHEEFAAPQIWVVCGWVHAREAIAKLTKLSNDEFGHERSFTYMKSDRLIQPGEK